MTRLDLHGLSLVLLAALCALVAPAAHADLGGFVIRSFDTTLEIEADAGLLVEERIQVEFLEPRHGIYRTIPVRYTDPRGYQYSLGFRFLGVGDGSAGQHDVKVSHEGAYVKLRIGSADRRVQGAVSYVVRYRLADALREFPEHQELYWNATGHEWNSPIERASVTIRLPGPVDADSLEGSGYTGRFGSREEAVRVSRPEPDLVRFESTRPLEPLEGLTVVAAWPPGLVSFPGPLVRALRFAAANWILVAPIVALAWLTRRWRSHGRDPRGPGSVVVRYEPPPDASPGEVGTLLDESADLPDITATLVDLAVRGHLRIRTEKRPRLFGLLESEATSFEGLEGGNGTLLRHERLLLAGLFEKETVVELSDLQNRFYRHLPGIKAALYEQLVERGHFAAPPDRVRRNYIVAGFAFAAVVLGAGLLWTNWRGGVMPHAAIAPALAAVATLLSFVGFARAMPRRTRRGVEVRAWALGFQEFVDRVEREPLEANAAREVFERLLPYAMALGVATRWAKRFEGIYDSGAPSWYVGAQPSRVFSTRALHSDLSSIVTKAGAAMASMPRSSGSSGSGGGGSSGGGGGGGGGGSW